MATKTKITREWLADQIGRGELAQYLTGDSGDTFGVDADGSTHVGDSVGREIDPDERPIATAKCRGIGNLDMTWWRDGWPCAELSDEDVIRDCCRNGEVEGEIEDLIDRLMED